MYYVFHNILNYLLAPGRVKLLIMNVNFFKSKKGKTKQYNHFGALKSNYMSLKVFVVCVKFSTTKTYLESII